jgi:hypothetical protein
MTVFVNGRQKRVRRPQLVDGIPADEFLAQNANPLWLHQNEMWEIMPLDGDSEAVADALSPSPTRNSKPAAPDQDVLPT